MKQLLGVHIDGNDQTGNSNREVYKPNAAARTCGEKMRMYKVYTVFT